MNVKVVFIRDTYSPVRSEETVEPGDGWSLVASIPLPVPTFSGEGARNGHRSGMIGQVPRESYARVALVFVKASDDDGVVDLRDPADDDESRTREALQLLTERSERHSTTRLRRDALRAIQPPPPPPPPPEEFADGALS